MKTKEQRLAELRELKENFDPEGDHSEAEGWRLDHYCQELPNEAPGEPEPDGPFEAAQELLRNYQVADPRMVRATYDPESGLEHRTMLLQVRYGPIRLYAGCRTGDVIDEEREVEGRTVKVWGWPYRTLEGHFEQGQMTWEVWKWLDNGDVEFHVHSYSRNAENLNPIINLGFKLVGQRQRRKYLQGACDRMSRLTAEAVDREPMPVNSEPVEPVR